MSSRSAARGKAAANSIRLTSRTSKAVATSRASPSRCFLFCRGSRAARSAPIAAATVAIPPIRKPPQARRIPFKHRKVQRARKSDGWQALDMYEHSYHIDYGAKAATYVDTFMEAVRWQNADRLYAELS